MMLKLLGLGFILGFFILILIFAYFERKGRGFALREIYAYKRLKREIGLAVEGGKRLHITLGHGGHIRYSSRFWTDWFIVVEQDCTNCFRVRSTASG